MDSNGILFIDDDKIPEQAHKGDLSIRKIHIGKNVSTIGAEAFSMCPNLEAIEVDEDNLRFTSETATCYMLTFHPYSEHRLYACSLLKNRISTTQQWDHFHNICPSFRQRRCLIFLRSED